MNHLLFHNYPGACNFEKGEYDWPDTAYDDSDDCVDLNDLHELALRLQPAPRLKVSSKAVIAVVVVVVVVVVEVVVLVMVVMVVAVVVVAVIVVVLVVMVVVVLVVVVVAVGGRAAAVVAVIAATAGQSLTPPLNS